MLDKVPPERKEKFLTLIKFAQDIYKAKLYWAFETKHLMLTTDSDLVGGAHAIPPDVAKCKYSK